MSSLKFSCPKGDVEFGVTRLPNHVNKVLFVMRGAMLEPLAYFRSDDDADRFEKTMDFIIENASGRIKDNEIHD